MKRTTKNVSLVLVIALVLSLCLAVFAGAAGTANVQINGKAVTFTDDSGYPFVDANKRTMVPLRVTMEAAGFSVGYDSAKRTAIVANDEVRIEVPIGTNKVYVNNELKINDTEAVIQNGRTYLPIRIVLESVGFTVDWDGTTRTVIAKTEDGLNPTALLPVEDLNTAIYPATEQKPEEKTTEDEKAVGETDAETDDAGDGSDIGGGSAD